MTRLASLAAAPQPAIPAPHIEYWQLSPMLLVFGVAVAGVLVEAFAPRAARQTAAIACGEPLGFSGNAPAGSPVTRA